MRTVTGLVVVVLPGAAILAGAADGKHKPRPKPYKVSGHVNAGGQDCFAATFGGSGGWSTNYLAPDKTKYDESSSYSWDVSEREAGAGCGLSLLTGYKPTGGANFNTGSIRASYRVDDTFPTNDGPQEKKCDHSGLTHVEDVNDTGFTLDVRGSSLIFVATIPTYSEKQSCEAQYALPGQQVDKIGHFLTASSAAIPRKAFENARKVTVTISREPGQAPPPNCGLDKSDGSCTQKGNWQGTLTFTQS
jgi:hypothetical protein